MLRLPTLITAAAATIGCSFATTAWALTLGSGSVFGTFQNASFPQVVEIETIYPAAAFESGNNFFGSPQYRLFFDANVVSPNDPRIISDPRFISVDPIPNASGFFAAHFSDIREVNGLGTSEISTGFGFGGFRLPTSFSFTANDFSEQPKGESFSLGQLSFFNGTTSPATALYEEVDVSSQLLPIGSTVENPFTGDIFSDISTTFSTVDLAIQTFSAQPDFAQELLLTLELVSTSNRSGTNEGDADFIFFRDRPELGRFAVFEDQETSIEILAEFNSLDLVGFGAVSDSSRGFFANDLVEPPAVVPLPASAWFLLSGIAAMVFVRRRRSA